MKTIPSPGDAPLAAATGANEHSVLVLNEVDGESTLFKMQVESDHSFVKRPKVAKDKDKAKRLVFSLTGATLPNGVADPAQPHVAYGILPIKADPTSAHYSCHLINSQLLYPQNVWTDGPWNGPPAGGVGNAVGTLALLATPDGSVLEVTAEAPPKPWTQDQLKSNPEVWRLLRNGCVVGMVPIAGQPNTLTPLINVATFLPPLPDTVVPGDIQGTWDFKWPRGSTIKLRIDPPDESGKTAKGWRTQKAQLDQGRKDGAVAKVKELAELWLSGSENPGNFSLVFVDSPSTDYDVLINLDPLAASGKISAPQSALGTYARRTPLNKPTSYCGHPEGLKQADDYYTSAAFTHIVLHELGHVFGLPHLHQHPGWPGPIIQPDRNDNLGALIRRHVGLIVDEKTLDADMREPWPGKADEYADWLPLGLNVPPGALAGQSIMMGHPIRGVLEGDNVEPHLSFFPEPGPKDYEWLQYLYNGVP
jgi:hypothetical protein